LILIYLFHNFSSIFKKRKRKIMRFDIHSPFQIKSVRGKPPDVRNEFDLSAILALGVFDNPIEKLAAATVRTLAAFGSEVFDFQIFAAREPLGDSDAADGFYFAVVGQINELKIMMFNLSFDRAKKFGLRDVRAKFCHYRVTVFDFRVAFGDFYFSHNGFSASGFSHTNFIVFILVEIGVKTIATYEIFHKTNFVVDFSDARIKIARSFYNAGRCKFVRAALSSDLRRDLSRI